MSNKIEMTDFPKPSSDPTEIIEFFIGVAGATIAWIYFIAKYFKSKAEEKKEFIENVVVAAVKAIMESEFKGVKENINKLFDLREDDRNHNDAQFKELMRELKK